jgi:hypothetical protein
MCDIQPRLWPDVVCFYQDLASTHGWKIDPMLKLVEQIAASGFAVGLFPYTSHSTLCIAHTHKPRMRQEELRITFDPTSDEFHFEYWSHPFVKPGPWETRCHSADGFPTLKRILLKRTRWFKQEARTEQSQRTSAPDQPNG